MTNRYFNNTIDLINNTRARASDVESNFTAVEAGMDVVQAEMDTKAPTNSPAFTGTPTAPTAAPGSSSTQIATTAFVAAQAFSAALPGQTGNAGKTLRTDGVNASWSSTLTPINVIAINTGASAFQSYVMTASLTLTLPASPAAGDWVVISNRSGTTTPVVARNGQNIMGLAEDFTVDIANFAGTFVFADATRGWIIV